MIDVQEARSNTAGVAAYTGPIGQLIINTDTWAIHVQDGTTAGGHAITPVAIPVTVANGGTGDSVLTNHAVLLGQSTSPVAFATVGTSGRMLLDQGASADPAFRAMAGDGTLSGGGTFALSNIPSGTSMAGSVLATNIAAPGTPAAAHTSLYVDSTQKVFSSKNDGGTVSITSVPVAAAANLFLTGLGSSGIFTSATVSTSNLSGTLSPLNGGTGVSNPSSTALNMSGTFSLSGGGSLNVSAGKLLTASQSITMTAASAGATWTGPYSSATLLSTQGVVGAFTPANPTATGSTTAVQMGLGSTCSFTPVNSSRVYIRFIGTILQTIAGQDAFIIARYGTGSAPANGDAATGNAVGPEIFFRQGNNSPAMRVPFSVGGLATGLTPGSTYWMDLACRSTATGTTSVSNLGGSVMEI